MIKNIKMRSQLVFLLVFLFLNLFYITKCAKGDNSITSKEISTLAYLAVEISAYVHETQKEMGMTAGFLGSKGKAFREVLARQRKITNHKRDELTSHIGEFYTGQFGQQFDESLDAGLGQLGILIEKRDLIDDLKMSVTEALQYYTYMNANFLAVINHISKLSSNAEFSIQLIAYVNFLKIKEKAGIERAILTNTFARNKFGKSMFNRFSALVTEQNVYTEVFISLATTEQVNFYNKIMANKAVAEVNRMEKIAFEKADKGNFDIDPAYWFKSITMKINLLKVVENKLSEDLMNMAAQIKKSRSWLFNR